MRELRSNSLRLLHLEQSSFAQKVAQKYQLLIAELSEAGLPRLTNRAIKRNDESPRFAGQFDYHTPAVRWMRRSIPKHRPK